MITKKELFDSFLGALRRQDAAIFVGAGLSVAAGYPTWSELLERVADELGLDLDKEHDLARVAQYYLNRKRKRTPIAELIKKSFPSDREIPQTHLSLARLPIRNLWTTNFDTLIERAWDEQGKPVDVKMKYEQHGVPDPDAAGVLYKMHGCVTDASNVVIATDDFELYLKKYPGFRDVLRSTLTNHTMLFLGLSFSDPNLHRVLSHVRAAFHEHTRRHFTVVKRPTADDSRYQKSGGAELLEYESNRFDFWVRDLQRYGVEAYIVDRYSDIPPLLADLERLFSFESIFVSGAYPLESSEDARRVRNIAEGVGRHLAEQRKRLISGFGLTVGDAVIVGFLEELYGAKSPDPSSRMSLHPFPDEKRNDSDFKTKYRKSMMKDAGACVFISGQKDEENAEGVIEEYELARQEGRIVIPIGASGGASAELWQRARDDFDDIFPNGVRKMTYDRLNRKRDTPRQLVASLGDLIEELEGAITS